MTTLYPVFASESTVMSTELNSLADGSGATNTSETNNTSTKYQDGQFACNFAAAAATTATVSVYLLEGTATGVLSTTVKRQNMRFIGAVELNGTTAVQALLRAFDLPKYFKLRVLNDSGAALASSGNTIKFTGINYADA